MRIVLAGGEDSAGTTSGAVDLGGTTVEGLYRTFVARVRRARSSRA